MSDRLPKPQIRDFPTTCVVGLERRFEAGELVDIGSLWAALREQAGEISNPTGTAAFGISRMRDHGGAARDYLASVEVSDLSDVPDGMTGREIGGGKAAFFLIKLTGEPFGEVIGNALGAIWRVWMPTSGFEPTADYDIERLDYRFNPKTLTGAIELVVPVKPRS
jgi:AraC family transcriptional regulator